MRDRHGCSCWMRIIDPSGELHLFYYALYKNSTERPKKMKKRRWYNYFRKSPDLFYQVKRWTI